MTRAAATEYKHVFDGEIGTVVAEFESQRRMRRFLKRDSGFERVHFERLQAETGVRETFPIDGETRHLDLWGSGV